MRHIPRCVRLHIPACSSCCAPPLVFDGFIIPKNKGNKADLLRRCHSICWRNIRFLRAGAHFTFGPAGWKALRRHGKPRGRQRQRPRRVLPCGDLCCAGEPRGEIAAEGIACTRRVHGLDREGLLFTYSCAAQKGDCATFALLSRQDLPRGTGDADARAGLPVPVPGGGVREKRRPRSH